MEVEGGHRNSVIKRRNPIEFGLVFNDAKEVAGWGLTSENGEESPVLLYENLPYVDIDKCIDNAPRNFRRFITSDKICAGYTNGTALCRGDSGGGLVFRGLHESKEKGDRLRYYLKGIASTAPTGDNLCNLYAITSFTHLLQHEYFIRDHYSGKY
ncbi:CLIP domain-containing serine protease 2 [Eumeta japonica]|uniref:CLIP domain-containing serine protease 2 n=1 Tax=Eumeta variegata TaxID=151549 RepID=A0A4C1UWL2_EUMVA|nr:CLIP domain-containing serine protease 2 [Eumeta japonica]